MMKPLRPIDPKGKPHCIDCLNLDITYDKKGHPTGTTTCVYWGCLRAPYSNVIGSYDNICSGFMPRISTP
jgi:hypothetical protein